MYHRANHVDMEMRNLSLISVINNLQQQHRCAIAALPYFTHDRANRVGVEFRMNTNISVVNFQQMYFTPLRHHFVKNLENTPATNTVHHF